MPTPIRGVIFDWAGTMIDFGCCAPVVAMQQAFAAAGVAVSAEAVRRPMGRAKRDHIDTMLADPEVIAAWLAATGRAPSAGDVDRIFAAVEPLMGVAAADHATLIPGAIETIGWLRQHQISIGSCTGYTRAMMTPVLPRAAAQGYVPEVVVCAGETREGRPSPLMAWKAMVEMGVWPAGAVLKVDDAEVGMAEGRNAGCITVGVAASGNLIGLDAPAYAALDAAERAARLAVARAALIAAGADHVIDTVADLPNLVESLIAG